MTLDKNDLKEIKKIVDNSADETKKVLRTEIQLSTDETKKDLSHEVKRSIEGSINNFAAMVKRSFDNVDDKFGQMDKRFDKLEKGQQEIKKDISHLEFIATEMVRRDEFIELKTRLTKIEAKLGLVK